MRITTRGQLAVSAMTDLALRQKMRPVALSTISARQGTSLSYLEQLFSALRRAGLVDSTRGPGGGYTLARNTDQISVAEIILAVENLKTDDLQSLGAGQAAQVKSMTGELWSTFNARVMEYLQSVTLQDLVAQQHAKGVVAEEMANAKQTVEAGAKTQQSTIKKQKMAAKTTAEVVWRPSVENGNAATVAVAANAMAESGGGDHSDSRRGVTGSSSDVIENHRSTGESWSNTSPSAWWCSPGMNSSNTKCSRRSTRRACVTSSVTCATSNDSFRPCAALTM